MPEYAEYDKIANKLAHIEDKITDIEKIAKTLDIWIKENDYELIPIAKMLNNKINEAITVIKS